MFINTTLKSWSKQKQIIGKYRIFKSVGYYKKCNTSVMKIPQWDQKKGKMVNNWKLTKEYGSSENSKKDKWKTKQNA